MLERYIVKPMKRWHLKLNYIAPSPKRTTPALKHFHSIERGKELATQEQNGHSYQCSHDKSSRRINRRLYNKLTPRQNNIDNPQPRLCGRHASLYQQLQKTSAPIFTRRTWEIHLNLGRILKIRRRSTWNGQKCLVSNRMGIRLKRLAIHQRTDPSSKLHRWQRREHSIQKTTTSWISNLSWKHHKIIALRNHSIANPLTRQSRMRESYPPHICLTIIHMCTIIALSSRE